MTAMRTISLVRNTLSLPRQPVVGQFRKAENRVIGGTRWRRGAHGAPELGRTRARIASRFLIRSRYGAARLLEGRRLELNFGHVPRAAAACRAVREEPLHDAVLQRVKRHDRQTSAGLEHSLGGKQRPRQFAELVI